MIHPCDKFSDVELEDMLNTWQDHYTQNGESHYSNTPDWKIREVYWDKMIEMVLQDVDTEMSDAEIEKFDERLSEL